MLKTQKSPLIQCIVPNAEDYLQQVDDFYQHKIQSIMCKIVQFIAIAIELTEIPQHLSLEFSNIKNMSKPTQQEREIQHAMLKDEIEKFLYLRNQVIQTPTGTKYLYPQLPKIQRNLHKRKYSKSQSTSSQEQKNHHSHSRKQSSVNQICDLLGTLSIDNKSNDEICNSIENIIGELSKLNINSKSQELNDKKDQIQTEQQLKNLTLQSQSTTFNRNASVQLYEIRKRKKLQLLRVQSHHHHNDANLTSLDFYQVFRQKLLHIKQLFKTHLEKSVEKVTKQIQSILSKALKDIKQNEKVYVPIHRISKHFNQLNVKFYRSEYVIKCLHKYLMRKIKQCIMDSCYVYVVNGVEKEGKTNFRLRFFKHILIQNIFYSWLEHAIADLNRIIKCDGHFEMIKCEQNQKQLLTSSPEKDRSEKNDHDESTIMFPLHKGSFDNFIM